jgi:Divergent InlB B-repeat domain/RTX calcium-binding nonapeptide repeat (4 copies)
MHQVWRRQRLLRLAVAAALVVVATSATGAVRTAQAQAPCSPVVRTLANAPLTTDGAVAVTVDGLGAFQQADFNPPGPAGAGDMTKASSLYLGGPIGRFLRDNCGEGQVEVLSESPLTTRVSIPPLTIELTQSLGAIDQKTSTLTQSYRVRNDSGASVALALVRHVDGDVPFDGTPIDGAGASPDGSLLSQFDAADSAPAETLLGIFGSAGGNAAPSRWTIQPYPYEPQIDGANQIPAGHSGAVAPTPLDATLSQQWDVEIPAGGEVTFTTATRFGTPPNQHTLSVGKTGDGTVTSAPDGILCGAVCSAAYEEGTQVALAPVPDPGWSFAGWSGDCSGVGACVATMTGARSVTAHFNPPPPTPAVNVNATPLRGLVLVREPGTGRFVELTAADQLPVGTQVDTTNGAILLTAARAGGITDTTEFFDGLFTIQQESPTALTELQLNGGDFSCLTGTFSWQKNKKPVRRLWGSGKGKYRTRGRYSSATVRGTRWKTEDRCDGTLTLVEEGIVAVRDFIRNANVVLRAGQSYLAEPLGRSASRAGCTIIGTPGKDTLRGTRRRDVLCGLGGDDVLFGMGGRDRLYGGDGNDWLDGGAGNDYLNGGGGHDRLDGSTGRDYLWGGRGRDLLITRDTIRGNDRIQGGSGTDLCRTDHVRVCP